MPDTKEVVVTLKAFGESRENAASEPKIDVGSPETDKSDSIAKSTYKTMGVQALKIVLNEAVAWAEYAWNKELTLNDDYIGQRTKRIAIQCINKTISYGSAIATGAMMGAAAGPIGAAVGATIAGLTVGLQTARENAQALDQQNIALRQMEAQLSYTRQRAGWSLEAASIGEDL